MNRDGIVGFGVNRCVVQELKERIALFRLFGLEDVKMKNVMVTLALGGESEILRTFQAGSVTSGPFPAEVIPGINVLELGAEDAGVKIVQSAVESVAMDVAGVGAVVAELADGGVNFLVIRNQRAAVAERAEIFLDNEAGSGRVAQFGDFESIAARADGLGIILDDIEFMFVGDFANGLHVGALAVEMDRDDSLGLGCDSSFDFGGVNAAAFGVAIHKNGGCAGDP